jgi:hypothetical protein
MSRLPRLTNGKDSLYDADPDAKRSCRLLLPNSVRRKLSDAGPIRASVCVRIMGLAEFKEADAQVRAGACARHRV